MKYLHIALSLLAFADIHVGPGALAKELGSSRPILETTTADWSVEVITDDLSYPWNINRVADVIVITEASGNIVMLRDGRLNRYAVETSDPIVHDGGSGLLGMALSEDFKTTGLAYLYHTYRLGFRLTNKVIEARFNGVSWQQTRVLLEGIPGHRLYNGGRIAIGPDGHLYVTTGWTESGELPQDLGSLAGKILRMTRAGLVPKDNPFEESYVYSYGHRNPQGLAWSDAGDLFVSEHGQSGRDEINLVRPGANYGWPLISGDEKRAGMETPLFHSGNDTWAPSGIAFMGKELLVAALAAHGLFVADPTSRTLKRVLTSDDRLRDVMPVERDVYVITTNRSPRGQGPSKDRLLRISPERLGELRRAQ